MSHSGTSSKSYYTAAEPVVSNREKPETGPIGDKRMPRLIPPFGANRLAHAFSGCVTANLIFTKATTCERKAGLTPIAVGYLDDSVAII